MKNKYSFIDNTCLSKMTDKEMQSWNVEMISLFFATCLSSVATSLYGIKPFADLSTTISFFIALFFYGITIICLTNFKAKEKNLPLINDKKKFILILISILFIHLLEFALSFLILIYNVKDGETTVSVNILLFFLFALIITIPYGLLLNHFFISPINKAVSQFRKNFEENNM